MDDQKTVDREPTFGEKAVGLSFNPGGDVNVTEIKKICSILIDKANNTRAEATDPEIKRMLEVGITYVQTAQMWLVKAITWSK